MMEKKIDEFFKNGLSEPDIEMPESDWLAMEKVLDKKENKNEIRSLLLIWASGIAAMLIVALFLIDTEVKPTSEKITKKQTEIPKSKAGEQGVSKITVAPVNKPVIVAKSKTSVNNHLKTFKNDIKSKLNHIKSVNQPQFLTSGLHVKEINVVTNKKTNNLFNNKDSMPVIQNNAVLIPESNRNQESTLIDSVDKNAEQLVKLNDPSKLSKTTSLKTKYRKSLTLSINAGSDINAVGSFKNADLGTNAGVLATWQVSPKVSLTSGIVYAKKLYNSEYKNYKPTVPYGNTYNPTGVSADCRVLDIPLNINYNIWGNRKGKIIVSGGASSYLMLKESYKFLYADYDRPVTYYGENQHYLGVLNFALAYERITSSKTSISFQPYVKLPITGIGQGNVNLLSTGLSVNFNLNLKKKHD
ncbi:MAG: hypothetical protein JWN56_1571 [Sphingobacteriales bacterium]|nr:hypothetical protein [Sphingobacteriales bacterium]